MSIFNAIKRNYGNYGLQTPIILYYCLSGINTPPSIPSSQSYFFKITYIKTHNPVGLLFYSSRIMSKNTKKVWQSNSFFISLPHRNIF